MYVRDRRVVAPEDLSLGVLAVSQLVHGADAARRPRAAETDGSVHVGAAVAAAQRVHEALIAHGDGAGAGTSPGATGGGVVAGARQEMNRLRAELLAVGRPLLGDGVERLVPTDALEVVAAALAHALHGVQDAVGAVDATSVRETLGANAVILRVRHITRRRANDLTVAHVHVQEAATRAVAAAHTGKDLLGASLRRVGDTFRQSVGGSGATRQRTGGSKSRGTRDKRAASEAARLAGQKISHIFPLYFTEHTRRRSHNEPGRRQQKHRQTRPRQRSSAQPFPTSP